METNPYSRYNRPDRIQSKYQYQGTEVYINKFGIKDPDILLSIENDLTYQRLSELHLNPMTGRFGTAHLQKIHHYIFQDLYRFAGKIREEDIIKGTTRFCGCQFILSGLHHLFAQLKEDMLRMELSFGEFTQRSAHYLAELNLIHPFREGNGRAIREYYRCLAQKCGYWIDWSLVDKEELMDAFIYAVDHDTSRIVRVVSQVIEKT